MNNPQFEYFKFVRNHNDTRRYRVLSFKLDMTFLRDLKIEGFKVLHKTDYSVTFKIKKQFLRKLKLLKFKNEKETISNNSRLLALIKKSKSITEEDAYTKTYSNTSWYYNSSSDDFEYDDYEINERELRKKYYLNNNKVYNQRLKQHEKTKWLRK